MWQSLLRAARNETVIVALAMLLLTLSAYRALAARERANSERTTAIAAESASTALAAEIALRVRPVERLAVRLALRPGTPRAEFDEEAVVFTSAYAGYVSIEWLDSQARLPVLDAVRSARTVRATPIYSLPQGGRGVSVAAPVVRPSGIEGFVVGSFGVSEVLQSVAEHAVPAGYVLSVYEGKQEISRLPRDAPVAPGPAAERALDVYGVPWKVRVWPGPQSLADVRSIFPGLVLAAGLVFTTLVTLAVRLAARARADSRALAEANRRLETEISDRRQAAENIRQANEALKAVIDTSPVAIVRMSPDGAVTSWNRAAEETLGWREHEVLGKPLPAGGPDTPELWRARARAGQPLHGIECTLRRKNGAPLDAEVWVAPQRGASGQISGFICMIADAGSRKQLERQLRDSSKLDAVSRLAGGVAHNFNNLLAVITGYAHLVLEDLPPGGPLRGEIEEVLKAADRAARLTVQLLAFGRAQTVRPRIVDLNEAIDDVRDVLENLAGEVWEITTPLGAGLGQVRVDPEQVEQILMTLVINAREAMPEGGRIVIETANVEVSGPTGREHLDVPSGLYVVLSVSDHGPGMDAQTRSHLFEPFFTRKGLGPSGLGLSSVYGIAKQNGGGVAVVSEPGQGARIEVYLPRI